MARKVCFNFKIVKILLLSTFKKCATWEWRVKFYLGPNEDCSPGDSISDSSEKRLQRGSGGRSVYMWFWWRRSTCNRAHIFFVQGFCQSRGAVVTIKDFSAFLDMRRYKNWAHKISSWKYLSEDLFCQFFPEHRVPHFCSPPELLSGGVESQQLQQHMI